MRKLIKNTLFTTAGIALSTLCYAASPATPSSLSTGGGTTPPNGPSGGGSSVNSQGIETAIGKLGNEIQAIATASVKSVNNSLYQVDQFLANIMDVNANNAIVANTLAQNSFNKTENDITYSLQNISDAALTYSSSTEPAVVQAQARMTQQNDMLSKLTLDTPASDTLYSLIDGIGSQQYATGGPSLTQPTTLNNDYFNFGALIAPTAYDLADGQQTAANNFVNFITQRYQSLTSGIDFSTLVSYINKQSTPKAQAQALSAFVSSSTWQQYQLNVRSLVTTRSVALSNLNYLETERTPMTLPYPIPSGDATLASQLNSASVAAGITPAVTTIPVPGRPTGSTATEKVMQYASPLQIKSYIANHRVNNTNDWYQHMATASPATVQRETLYVLAEIESQMYQQHLDNDRMIATLSAMEAQNSSTQLMTLKTDVQGVNQEIDSITGTKPSYTTGSTPHS